MYNSEDERQLRNLMERYADAANRRDGTAWGATWAEDGCWSLAGQEVHGREQIITFWRQMLATFEFAIILPSSGLFELEGDRATGHWYLQEFTRDLEGNVAMLLSRYRDSYTRVDGQWLYSTRHYDVMYYGPGDLSGAYTPLP